jgi:hypothetical protein
LDRHIKDLVVHTMPVDQITPDMENLKVHTPDQIEHLVASIRQFGFNDPVAVWGESNLLVEGHGRLEAAKVLGMKNLPVIRLDHLSPTERKAYAIAHNQHTLSSPMDDDILGEELERLAPTSDEVYATGLTDEDMLFLGANSPMPLNSDGYVPPTLKTTFRFKDQRQTMLWAAFLKAIKTRYPEAQTLAEALDYFVIEFGPVPK